MSRNNPTPASQHAGPISKSTAMDLALAYRDMEMAETLLAQILETMDRKQVPDIRDAFGRQVGGLQLGVPNGASGHRLFDVPWPLARPILEAYIASKRAAIAALSEKARAEIGLETIQ
ncbi:hypothetical protein [Rhizobium sp. SYY.PMSO]|uniref:hypothetical protein n=1 Tax=Rhizobium sp. SYY.PMSO TaxID=3382192 RepID=UPI00398FAFDC